MPTYAQICCFGGEVCPSADSAKRKGLYFIPDSSGMDSNPLHGRLLQALMSVYRAGSAEKAGGTGLEPRCVVEPPDRIAPNKAVEDVEHLGVLVDRIDCIPQHLLQEDGGYKCGRWADAPRRQKSARPRQNRTRGRQSGSHSSPGHPVARRRNTESGILLGAGSKAKPKAWMLRNLQRC